ncbi:MAG: HAMP domain-containing sensor histidine kinase [Candidatus Shapirobacteria bacterium]|nr:HAMP domain-containing sensor histidine kinase [Candidatus Shapirobacteria bacterium]
MFKQARLKLTAWYLLIIMVISFSFSGLIYTINSNEINRFANSQRNRIERQFVLNDQNPHPPLIFIDDDLIQESLQRLLINLIIINGVILIISGSLSYFLAGKTLFPIQKMTEDQKRFISDASHELRTPLTGLKSLFEVSLRDKKINLIEAKKVIATGIDQTDKLKILSDSLLELSRFENDNLKTNYQPVFLKKVILEAISQIKIKAIKKDIKIINKISSEKILGDSDRLTEVFIIFLDNAIKYSPAKSRIKLISKIQKNNLIVEIIDQGIGISQENLPHIFDRFYQADNARTKTNDSGYGLGLSIAQKIIKSHQGKIEVVSKLNHGTTFIIYLPLFS